MSVDSYQHEFAFLDSDADPFQSSHAEVDEPPDAALIVALRNLAPLLVDLWEAAEEHVEWSRGRTACEDEDMTMGEDDPVVVALRAIREARP